MLPIQGTIEMSHPLRLCTVKQLRTDFGIPYSRQHLWRMQSSGQFPRAVKLGQCLDTKATEPEVNSSIAEGRALGIQGTPTLFINGRKIGGLMWPDLQMVINKELEYSSPGR